MEQVELCNGKYTRLNELGKGSYAIVYKANDNQNQNLVALKKMLIVKDYSFGLHFVTLREITLLRELPAHPNIIKFVDTFISRQNVYLVLEYMVCSLETVINDGIKMSEFDQKLIFRMILRGLNHIHTNWLLHRDLKPANLLFDSNGILKITDFGLARTYADSIAELTPTVIININYK
eukprot:TRINITY_DN3844_c1_g2_i1.p1 TRINITY_DN3844_c1_g2~~TRINITY_DN3844_c1_g2_i1.p1  ORF type:complete len:178 (-),score=54.43 TRINITY_DN3844_c1_g2_i1:50-583(-)